jgi:hypothetical protein
LFEERGTCFFRIQVVDVGARHVLGQADGLEAEGDGAEDDGLEGVDGVAGAEFARVGVHGEGHFWVYGGRGSMGEGKSGRVGKCSRVKIGVEGILGSLQWRRGIWRVDGCGVSVSISSPTT